MLNVWVDVVEDILKSVPVVPVANDCICAVNPFKAVKPLVKVVITWHKWLLSVCNVIVRPLLLT